MKTIRDLQLAYSKGQRQFDNWDFEEEGSVQGLDLTGVEFGNCFMFLDFQECKSDQRKVYKLQYKDS